MVPAGEETLCMCKVLHKNFWDSGEGKSATFSLITYPTTTLLDHSTYAGFVGRPQGSETLEHTVLCVCCREPQVKPQPPESNSSANQSKYIQKNILLTVEPCYYEHC